MPVTQTGCVEVGTINQEQQNPTPPLRSPVTLKNPDLSILVPWRSGDPDREKAWTYIQNYWEYIKYELSFNVEIIQGGDTGQGPFNCAMAINDAFKVASGKYVAIYGADCLPSVPSLEQTMSRLDHGNDAWVPMYSTVEYYDKKTSQDIYDGAHPTLCSTDPSLNVPFQTAFLAMPSSVYKIVGGHDERFVGWGAEDSAFRRSLHVMFGHQESINLPMHCLWHATGHRIMSKENYDLCREYEQLNTIGEMADYLNRRGSFV
jgi:hypothetical protein